MWSYPWTHVGTRSHPGHLDWVAATLPSKHLRERLKGHLS